MPRRPPTWTHILIHHSAGDDARSLDLEAIRHWHVDGRGWSDIGYHAVVERVGDAYVAVMGRPLVRAGAHCPGMNRRAIGVCLVGDFTSAPPPAEQLEVAADLVAGLCHVARISPEDVRPHRDFKNTACPGAVFPWELFVSMVVSRVG